MIAQHTLHPVQTLNALCKRYPNLTQQVNAAWSKKLADPGLWPEWCLLPMDEWARIIEQQEQLRACLETHLSIMKRFNSMLAMAI